MRNKTFLLFIFITVIHATGIAQQDKMTDSLLNVLKPKREMPTKRDLMIYNLEKDNASKKNIFFITGI